MGAPLQTNSDVTLYNRYLSSGAEKYQRTVITGVAWENRKAANVLASGGNIASDQVAVYIPLARGAAYVAPKAWLALSSKTGYWTLNVGDVIVRGAVTDEIHEAVVGPPAVAAFRLSDLKAKYDDVLAITSVDAMDMGSPSMQHWQVGAK